MFHGSLFFFNYVYIIRIIVSSIASMSFSTLAVLLFMLKFVYALLMTPERTSSNCLKKKLKKKLPPSIIHLWLITFKFKMSWQNVLM